MKPSSLNTAVGVLFAVVGTVPGADAAGLKRFGRSIHQHNPRHHYVAPDASNSTSGTATVTAEPECSLEVITITTTLDITTTITAPPSDAPSSTELPEVVNTTCSTGYQGWNTSITSTASSTFLGTGVVSSTSEPCTEKPYPTWGQNSTITTPTTAQTQSILPTDEPCTDDMSSTSIVAPTVTLSISSQTKEPCTDDESSTSSSTADATATSVTSSTTTEHCDCEDDESSTSTATSTIISANEATETESSASVTVTPFSTVTSTTSSSQTTYPIDSSMTPITTAATSTMTDISTNTLPPTTTVCETSAPTGTPAPRAVHCGVHGLPVGDFFLGRFVEDRANVPVTLEGCWEFCSTAWGATNGCLSYDYYVNELGAPRCDLYSSRVAFALDTVDNNEPNLWFDLECGNPTDPKWTHSQPVTARSIRGGRRV